MRFVVLSVFLILLLAGVGSSLSATPDHGYTLNETAGTNVPNFITPASPGTASLANWESGIIDNAYRSDDSNYIDLGTWNALSLTNPSKFSISYWVKTDNNSQADIVSGTRLKTGINTNGDCEGNFSGAYFNGATFLTTCSDAEIMANAWTHVVYTMNTANNQQHIYINGVLRANSTHSDAASVTTTQHWGIGYRGATQPAAYFDGVIDQVMLFHNDELSTDDAVELYEAGRVFNALTIQSPQDGSIVFLPDLEVNYTVHLPVTNCSLHLDTTPAYNVTILDRSNQTISNLTEGNYQLTMTCFNTTESHTISLDFEMAYIYRLDNCTEYSDVAMYIDFKDENLLTPLNTSLSGTFEWEYDSVTYNFTITNINVTNHSICIYPDFANISVDAVLYYEVGEIERYYIENYVITNTPASITAYNFGDTAGLSTLEARAYDQYYREYTQAISKLQRYYPDENVWRTVQIDKTDEFGSSLFYIYQYDIDYRILWELDGAYLDQTVPFKFICDSATECYQEFVIDPEASTSSLDAGISYDYNNATQFISLSWNEPTNTLTEMRLRVEEVKSNGVIEICDTSVSASFGTIVCNTTGYNGLISSSVYQTDTSTADPVLSRTHEKRNNTFSGLVAAGTGGGSMISFIMFMGTVGLGLWHPVAAVIGGVFAFVVLYLLNINAAISLSVTVAAVCLGLVVAFLVSSRRGV